jgi:hypothetical protein
MFEIEEATRGSVRFHTVRGIRELLHEEGYRVEPHGGLCRALYTRSVHTPVALFRTVHPIESHAPEQPNWDTTVVLGRYGRSEHLPLHLDIRPWHHRIGGCSPAQLVISMANGALIPYHGCHSNTDDSDFSDSMHS